MRPSRNSLRAPAEVIGAGYVSVILNRLLSRAADLIFPCRHKRQSLPYNNRQRCLDCGASRLYRLDFDFAHADAGIETGPWRKDKPFPRQDARRIVRSNLTFRGIARGPITGREAVLHPGAENPLFQPLQYREIETATVRVMDSFAHSQAVQR